jgi:hypothetical protein
VCGVEGGGGQRRCSTPFIVDAMAWSSGGYEVAQTKYFLHAPLCGLAIVQGSKAKPASWVRASSSEQSERQSDTKGGQQLARPRPHRGGPTSSSFVYESRLGGFLHAPLLKTTWFRFAWGGGGASVPVWSYGEAIVLGGSHPRMVIQAPLRSLLETVV